LIGWTAHAYVLLLPRLVGGDITLDSSERVVTRAGARLSLNPKKIAVLERAWDEATDPFSQAVKTTISRLRAKLGDPPIIETDAKSGYRIGG
jgi:DNA-binding response OmpR family regulator